MQEKDVGMNEEKTTNMDDEVNGVRESSRSLSFCKRMRELAPHHLLLKDRLKDKTVSYIDLFRPGPPPSKRDNETSRRMKKWNKI